VVDVVAALLSPQCGGGGVEGAAVDSGDVAVAWRVRLRRRSPFVVATTVWRARIQLAAARRRCGGHGYGVALPSLWRRWCGVSMEDAAAALLSPRGGGGGVEDAAEARGGVSTAWRTRLRRCSPLVVVTAAWRKILLGKLVRCLSPARVRIARGLLQRVNYVKNTDSSATIKIDPLEAGSYGLKIC
jgi:hypothetical protein